MAMPMHTLRILATLLAGLLALVPAHAQDVRLKDLGRFLGWRDNALTGYGLVTGLAGTGDSALNRPSRQALANLLGRMDLAVDADDLESRNVAAVMVTATLPPAAYVGDRLDVTVTSVGDARSLAGGHLVLTSLQGPDRRIYALAQGPLTVGGYRFDAEGNRSVKNHPTTGLVPQGGTVERAVAPDLGADARELVFVLRQPDPGTADRVAEALAVELGIDVRADAAGAVRIPVAEGERGHLNRLIARVEGVRVRPDRQARVVVNERTGTVVAGGDVRVSSATIAQGDLKVQVTTEVSASQPGQIVLAGPGVRSLAITNTRLATAEAMPTTTAVLPDTTVADLVQALARLRVPTRELIAILQALRAAGALHAELLVQ